MRRRKHPRSLANLFKSDFYENYKQLIKEINSLLKTPVTDTRHIDRLDFREDLPRGSLKCLYMAIADMLHAAGKERTVMAQGYSHTDLFLWMTDGCHTNLKISLNTFKASVYQILTKIN